MYEHNKVKVPILDKVDLRSEDVEIWNQGTLGSCTGHALAAAFSFVAKKEGKPINVSRLFIYYNERVMENTVKQDAGAHIRDGVKVMQKLGAPDEKYWPYNIEKFAKKPSIRAFTNAKKHQVLEYRRLAGIDDFMGALSAGYPVVFGFSVYESFETEEVAKTGNMVMPGLDERCLGGHAVTAVGYDKEKDIAIVRNSWDVAWGDKGYFYMPLDMIRNPNLSDDFWTITKVEIS
jgi:C1A family cysteine protease